MFILAGLNESRGTLFASRRVLSRTCAGRSLRPMQPRVVSLGAGPTPFNTIHAERRWPDRDPICGTTLALSVLQVSLLP